MLKPKPNKDTLKKQILDEPTRLIILLLQKLQKRKSKLLLPP